jgi:DNA methyltransferase 1-associated protein 1
VYPFAKFNRKAEVIKYTDVEYNSVVAPLISDWDKDETDVLFEQCEMFDLRFINIADRLSEEVSDRII